MKSRLAGITGIMLLFLVLSCPVYAQFKWGMQDVSIAVTSTQYGMPFIQFTPIHPGIELEGTFLKKEGKRANHGFSVNGGYFYHSVLANAIYIQGKYQYQVRVKDMFGIGVGAGAGYAHMIYPGEGYRYNETTGRFESGTYHKGFLLASAGLGISYIKPQTFQPFIRYDMMMFGDLGKLAASLKLGLSINL
jgi:hypothetical protein